MEKLFSDPAGLSTGESVLFINLVFFSEESRTFSTFQLNDCAVDNFLAASTSRCVSTANRLSERAKRVDGCWLVWENKIKLHSFFFFQLVYKYQPRKRKWHATAVDYFGVSDVRRHWLTSEHKPTDIDERYTGSGSTKKRVRKERRKK